MANRHFLWVLLVFGVSCALVWGQATAQINGTVKDTGGALISGASAKLGLVTPQ